MLTLNESYQNGVRDGLAEGIAQGKAQGKAEGVAQGKAEGIAQGVKALMASMGVGADEALRMIGVAGPECAAVLDTLTALG